MAAKQLQLRKGTTVQHSSFTGALAEVTVDTDKDTVVVHDGATVGGHPLAKAVDVEQAKVDASGEALAFAIALG